METTAVSPVQDERWFGPAETAVLCRLLRGRRTLQPIRGMSSWRSAIGAIDQREPTAQENSHMITLSLDRTAFREWMKASRIDPNDYAIVFERLLHELAANANGQPAALVVTQARPARQPAHWHLGPFSGQKMAEWELVQRAAKATFDAFTKFAVVDPGYYTPG